MATWNNTVPQGVIGTGNAQVYGVNPLANQFASQLAALRAKQEKDAQTLAKSWRENQLAASSGRLWAKEMSGIEKDFINRGIELQRKGVDPYGSSEEALNYQRDKRFVEAQQGYRKAVESKFNDAITKINANPDKYDTKSIEGLNNFFGQTSLSDAYNNNLDIPQLSERFDRSEFLKPLRALTRETSNTKDNLKIDETIIDEPGTQNLVIGALMQDPRGQQYISELSSGLGVDAVRGFSPDYNGNVERVTKYLQGNPVELERLAMEGVVPGTPEMQSYIDAIARQQTVARQKFDAGVAEMVNAVSTGVETSRKETPIRDPNELTEYQRQSANRPRSTGSTAAPTIVEPAQDLPLYYGGKNPDGSQPSATGRGVVKLPLTGRNFQGSRAINLHTGAPTTITSPSNDYEVVSVGNYPILNKNSGDLKAGTLVQDAFASKHPGLAPLKPMLLVQKKVGEGIVDNFLVDYKYLPKNLTKQQTEILGAFTPARSGQPAPAAAPKPAPGKSRTVRLQLNGKTGEIPADQVGAFLKKYPNAKRLN